jgi:hypothetical protein
MDFISYNIVDNYLVAVDDSPIKNSTVNESKNLIPFKDVTDYHSARIDSGNFSYYETVFSVNDKSVFMLHVPHEVTISDSEYYNSIGSWKILQTVNAAGTTVWIAETHYMGYYIYCVSTMRLSSLIDLLDSSDTTNLCTR